MTDPGAMTDASLMPFGKHQGTPMQNVPASYLLWLADSMGQPHSLSGSRRRLRAYIDDNREALEQEADEENRQRNWRGEDDDQ